jgi:hypothetical protein
MYCGTAAAALFFFADCLQKPNIGQETRVVDPDPDSVTLWIRIRIRISIGNPDPGSGSRGKKVKKFQ